MQIDSSLPVGQTTSSSAYRSSTDSTGFADALQNSLSAQGEKKKVLSPEQREQQRAAAAKANLASTVKEIEDYLKKTPAEHLRDKIMRELGLSEEKLAAMSPKERDAAEAKISARIREELTGRKPKPGDPASQLTGLALSDEPIGAQASSGNTQASAELQALITSLQAAGKKGA
jgi:hypothetical protein